jgi:hypothetical protein
MKMLAVAMIALLFAPVFAAGPPLIIHYNDRPPHHFSKLGVPQGDAIAKVSAALAAANIPYQLRNTPAKRQLVLLKANEQAACMLAWVDLPGRERSGKFSEVIYDDRRLWCTRAVPDETLQRLNAALRK